MGSDFSLAFKKDIKRRKTVNIQEFSQSNCTKDEILTFNGEIAKSEGSKPKASVKPIIPLENSFRKRKSYFPSFLPQETKVEGWTTDLENFEKAQEESGFGTSKGKYGLSKRNNMNRINHITQAEIDAKILKEDLEDLPPESSIDEYHRMPVEAFGEALLRGMGWVEGRGVGRNANVETKAKELIRRPERLGLGAHPLPMAQKEKRFVKPGESRETNDLNEKRISSASRPVTGKIQQRKYAGPVPGKRMYISGGRHSNFQCEVISINKDEASELAEVILIPSMQRVSINVKYLTDDSSLKRKNDLEEDQDKPKAENKSQRTEKPWLVSNIRVKIVDKKIHGGKLYLKKGTIVDVKTPTECDILVDGFKELFTDITQHSLETSVPRNHGTLIYIVAGKHKGSKGSLLHRSRDYAAVKLDDRNDIVKVHLDDLAEFRGVPW